MSEKLMKNKKGGMAALLITALLYLAFIGIFVWGAVQIETKPTPLAIVAMVVGGLWIGLGWIPFLGLKVLKPQEALVLTLFGNYKGTLKGEGFYFVNPFCVAVNPAAETKLNQSGDVVKPDAKPSFMAGANGTSSTMVNKKISLKIMTLNNIF